LLSNEDRARAEKGFNEINVVEESLEEDACCEFLLELVFLFDTKTIG
jgi:hypothetical protein